MVYSGRRTRERGGSQAIATNELELSDEVQSRIKAEEVFRQAVRDSLRATPTRSARMLRTFNQPIVLWFLSTVVISLVGWGYSQWQDARADEELDRTEQRKLDLEIYSRLEHARNRLDSARNMTGVREAISMLDEGGRILPEFRDQSFESLLMMLIWLAPDADRVAIEQAQTGYRELNRLVANAPPDVRELIDDVRLGYFDGVFAIRSWRGR